ncbi:MAG: hypothetical protein WC526_00705 [Patescibacteria group bacterium]
MESTKYKVASRAQYGMLYLDPSHVTQVPDIESGRTYELDPVQVGRVFGLLKEVLGFKSNRELARYLHLQEGLVERVLAADRRSIRNGLRLPHGKEKNSELPSALSSG